MSFYAVIQLGYLVFGVGSSAEEAIADAKQWVDGDLELIDERSAVDGDLIVVECTKALHDEVEERGGDVVYEVLNNGLFGLASEVDDDAEEN